MKPLLILLFIITAAQNASAQDTFFIARHTARENQPFNAVRLGVTTISILMPLVQVGLEHRWDKYSIIAGTGFVIPKRYDIDNTYRGFGSGYAFRLDGRLHNYTPDHSGIYLGLGVFFNKYKYPHVYGFADSTILPPNNYDDHDEYLLKKTTIGCVFQLGGHHYVGKRIDIDLSIGFGGKIMYTSQQGRTFSNGYSYDRHPNVHDIESRLGRTEAGVIQAQLSVAYILGK